MFNDRVDADLDLLALLHLRGGSARCEAFTSLDAASSRRHLQAAGLIYVGQDRVGLTRVGLWVATWITPGESGGVSSSGAIHPDGDNRPAEAR